MLEKIAPQGVTFTKVALDSEGNAQDCIVEGSVTTSGFGVEPGSARFSLRLPAKWNSKFLMLGNGGFAGSVRGSGNGEDIQYALESRYATVATDMGHEGESSLDATWALKKDGTPDLAKVIDYNYRATHDVADTAKQIVRAFYDQPIQRSYFTGCSTGGRMGMVEANRFPSDFDGIIAGAPFMDISSMLQIQHFQIAQLATKDAHIPASLVPIINSAITKACDPVDGVTDGLIQNPAACSFDPSSLICKPGQADACLNPDQAKALRAYYTGLYTDDRQLVFPGYSPAAMNETFSKYMAGNEPPHDINAAEPWGNNGNPPSPFEWAFSDHVIQYFVEKDPKFDVRKFGVTADGTISRAAVERFLEGTNEGNGTNLDTIKTFLGSGRKLILYHGLGDHALSPFRTIRYYDDLAKENGGYDALSKDARLFTVPDMNHCSGGTGPDKFNTLKALEKWVEQGEAPTSLLAESRQEDNSVTRSMPLCAYPTMAAYDGKGDVNDAASWSCTPNQKMLKVGSIGIAAGLTAAGRPTQ
ncbi:tannase/feruloyl esterase family alpha/beta hydrolase [Rhizobium sp. PAMB 3182]